MEPRISLFAGCFLGALTLVACSDDDDPTPLPDADVEVTDDAAEADAAVDVDVGPEVVTDAEADADADAVPDEGAEVDGEDAVPDTPPVEDAADAAPDLPEPDVPEPDVPEPDVPEPDVPEPDVPEPDVPEPDVVDVADAAPDVPDVEDTGPDVAPAGWVVLRSEDFDDGTGIGSPAWAPDPVPDDGPFADSGLFFDQLDVAPPDAWRITEPFGDADWLVAESYTRDPDTDFGSLFSVVTDPDGGTNQVLRIASPAHTDATVVRPAEALPARYRISLRVGHASFGDASGLNGYDGGESAEPWGAPDATGENGFYWLTILDHMPRPHNNVWIHHHRKVVVDSDNNVAAWTQIWNGDEFIYSGLHPVMMFALDGLGASDAGIGKPFIPYSAGEWQPPGTIRAADAYRDATWYDVTIERFDDTFTLTVSGDFLYGGQATYSGSLDAAERCIWHYNRPGEDVNPDCVDESSLAEVPGVPLWPADGAWPDWFMFGDPHANYYEGEVYFDDVTLEVWQ